MGREREGEGKRRWASEGRGREGRGGARPPSKYFVLELPLTPQHRSLILSKLLCSVDQRQVSSFLSRYESNLASVTSQSDALTTRPLRPVWSR